MKMHELTRKDLKVILAALERETSHCEGNDDLLYLHAWDAWGLQGKDYIRVFKKVSAMCGKETRK